MPPPSLRGRKPLLAAEDWWRKGFFNPEFYSPADPAHLAHAPREARFAARALRLRQGTALWAGVRAALAFFASRQERSGRGRPGDDEDESLFIG